MALDRLSVSEAARRLGIKEESVRKRVKRGSLESERDESGHVWVYVDTLDEYPDEGRDEYRDTYQDQLLDQLRSENQYLREESQRKDSIIMSLSQRLPELSESPHSATHSPHSAPDDAPAGTAPEPESRTSHGLTARFRRWVRGG
jgi:excisionase family DNA binding protein